MAKRWGKSRNSDWLYFLCSKITVDTDCSHGIKRCLLFGRKSITKIDTMLKSRDITLPTKVCIVKTMIFLVVMYGCQTWTIKKAEHWRADAFELWCWRRLLSWTPLDCKIKSVNPKGNQSWIFLGRTDAESKAPVLWPPDANSQLTGKDPDGGKGWRQEEKGRKTEDKMAG